MKKRFIPVLLMASFIVAACSTKKPGGTTPQPTPSSSGAVVAEYTITFTYCDGGSPVRIKGKDGSTINMPAGKSLDGKTFAGWSTEYDEDLGYGKVNKVVRGSTFKISGKNQTLYAAYYEKGTTPTVQPTEPSTPVTPTEPVVTPTEQPTQPGEDVVTVNFYVDYNFKLQGVVYATQYVKFGGYVTKPADPTTPFHSDFTKFLGWSMKEIVDDWTADEFKFSNTTKQSTVQITKANATTETPFDLFGIWAD